MRLSVNFRSPAWFTSHFISSLFPFISLHQTLMKQKLSLLKSSTIAGKAWDTLTLVLSIFACAAYISETYTSSFETVQVFATMEVTLTQIFLVDFVFNALCASTLTSYLLSGWTWVDVLTIAPVYIDLALHRRKKRSINLQVFRFIRILRLVRIPRMFKLLRGLSGVRRQAIEFGLTMLSLVFMSAGLVQILENDVKTLMYYKCKYIGPGTNWEPSCELNTPYADLPPESCDCVAKNCVAYYNNYDNYGQPSGMHCISLTFLDCIYYMVVTVATVGYGDITPSTDISKAVVIIFIITSLIVIPMQVNQLTTLLSATSLFRNQFVPANSEYHVIICGHVSDSRKMFRFFREFFHPDRSNLSNTDYHLLVLSPLEPSEDFKSLMNLPWLDNRLTYLIGSALSMEDLSKARADLASAIFFISNAEASQQDSINDDAATVLRTLSVSNFNPNVECLVQVVNQEDKVVLKDSDTDFVICLNEYRTCLQARNAVCPGITTMVENLFRSFCSTPIQKKNSKHDPPWMEQYIYGANKEAYYIPLSSLYLESMSFEWSLIAEGVYLEYDCMLIGVCSPADHSLIINPTVLEMRKFRATAAATAKHMSSFYTKHAVGVLICDEQSQASNIASGLNDPTIVYGIVDKLIKAEEDFKVRCLASAAKEMTKVAAMNKVKESSTHGNEHGGGIGSMVRRGSTMPFALPTLTTGSSTPSSSSASPPSHLKMLNPSMQGLMTGASNHQGHNDISKSAHTVITLKELVVMTKQMNDKAFPQKETSGGTGGNHSSFHQVADSDDEGEVNEFAGYIDVSTEQSFTASKRGSNSHRSFSSSFLGTRKSSSSVHPSAVLAGNIGARRSGSARSVGKSFPDVDGDDSDDDDELSHRSVSGKYSMKRGSRNLSPPRGVAAMSSSWKGDGDDDEDNEDDEEEEQKLGDRRKNGVKHLSQFNDDFLRNLQELTQEDIGRGNTGIGSGNNVVEELEDASLLKNHIIVFGFTDHLMTFCSELRRQLIQANDYHAIVVVHAELPRNWREITSKFSDIYFLRGDMTKSKDFNRTNIREASSLVLLAGNAGGGASGTEEDNADADSLFACLKLQKYIPSSVFFSVELMCVSNMAVLNSTVMRHNVMTADNIGGGGAGGTTTLSAGNASGTGSSSALGSFKGVSNQSKGAFTSQKKVSVVVKKTSYAGDNKEASIESILRSSTEMAEFTKKQDNWKKGRMFRRAKKMKKDVDVIWSISETHHLLPVFASGMALTPTSFDSLLIHTFYGLYSPLLCERLVVGSKFQTMFQIPLPNVFSGRYFVDLYRGFLARSIYVLGLYRSVSSSDKNKLPYVYTCPRPDTILRQKDRVFVYCTPSQLKLALEQAMNLPFVICADGSLSIGSIDPNKKPTAGGRRGSGMLGLSSKDLGALASGMGNGQSNQAAGTSASSSSVAKTPNSQPPPPSTPPPSLPRLPSFKDQFARRSQSGDASATPTGNSRQLQERTSPTNKLHASPSSAFANSNTSISDTDKVNAVSSSSTSSNHSPSQVSNAKSGIIYRVLENDSEDDEPET